MFGFGLWEICIVFFIVLIAVKPKDIPTFVHRFGRLYGEIMETYQTLLRNLRNSEETLERSLRIPTEQEDIPSNSPRAKKEPRPKTRKKRMPSPSNPRKKRTQRKKSEKE